MKRKIDLKKIQDKILNDYQTSFKLFLTTCEIPYCILEDKEIYLNIKEYVNPTYRSLFDLLHEIGHLKTNTPKMRRFEEEYYATEWAIQHADEYGVAISSNDKRDFEDYIYGLLDSCRKRKGKNLPTRNKLILHWN